jgi:hypothetical protein
MSMAIVCYGTVYWHTINTNNIYLLTVLSTESSSATPMPNPDLPADRWRNGGKGKRPPPQRASRQPPKYARNDDRDYSSSRTAPSTKPVISRPPNASGAPEPALQTKTSSRPRLTPREAVKQEYLRTKETNTNR